MAKEILPGNAASQIMSTGKVQPRRYEDVSILVCDLYGFTNYCVSPETVVDELEGVFTKFEDVFQKYDVEKIKTVGDCIVGASRISTISIDPVENILNCAIELVSLSLEQKFNGSCILGYILDLSLPVLLAVNQFNTTFWVRPLIPRSVSVTYLNPMKY